MAKTLPELAADRNLNPDKWVDGNTIAQLKLAKRWLRNHRVSDITVLAAGSGCKTTKQEAIRMINDRIEAIQQEIQENPENFGQSEYLYGFYVTYGFSNGAYFVFSLGSEHI